MLIPRISQLILLVSAWVVLISGTASLGAADEPEQITAEERQQIDKELADWRKERADKLQQLDKAPAKDGSRKARSFDRFDIANVDIYYKGLEWALRYDEPLAAADVALIRRSFELAKNRRRHSLQAKQAYGSSYRLGLGYFSTVDGSTQPFGVVLPRKYDSMRPIRLDVVLHGSSKPVGISELRFLDRFNPDDAAERPAPDVDYIELHPLGRVENCYRWSGETDVFEAIEAVCQRYNIDRDRIVLRGMSMGASGTWHLGLKHPDFFVALGPYCGYVDTHRFSRTPLPNFLVVDELPPHQEAALHMLDSVDYAANAGVVPCIAAMGEKDIFFDAHVIMGEAMRREGLEMLNLISPGTGHVIDPVTHAEQMKRIGEHATMGLNRSPSHIRFVTWTLKYPQCHWLKITRLKQHYARTEIEANVTEEGVLEVKEPINVEQFEVDPARFRDGFQSIEIAGEKVSGQQPPPAESGEKTSIGIKRGQGGWAYYDPMRVVYRGHAKSPGLQGPIDDAFCRRFLCVRGTGQPWNKPVNDWTKAALRRFEYEWARYFRGDLPVKDDTDVTQEDRMNCNLVLFGDPGSNRLIAEVLPQLPITWTREQLTMNGKDYAAADHAPVLIQRLDTGVNHSQYVVLNTGHSFHESELAKVNYLLFPRLGDWAVMQVGESQPEQPTEPVQENVVDVGFFDEEWKFPKR